MNIAGLFEKYGVLNIKGLYKNGIVLESWTDMNRHGPNPLLLLIASRGNIRYYDARPFTP